MSRKLKTPKVELVSRDVGVRRYRITEGSRTWAAQHNVVTGRWDCTSSQGVPLSRHGEMWETVVEACEVFAARELEDVA